METILQARSSGNACGAFLNSVGAGDSVMQSCTVFKRT